jgi:hypothetical protein
MFGNSRVTEQRVASRDGVSSVVLIVSMDTGCCFDVPFLSYFYFGNLKTHAPLWYPGSKYLWTAVIFHLTTYHIEHYLPLFYLELWWSSVYNCHFSARIFYASLRSCEERTCCVWGTVKLWYKNFSNSGINFYNASNQVFCIFLVVSIQIINVFYSVSMSDINTLVLKMKRSRFAVDICFSKSK